MSTVQEIEAAIPRLTRTEIEELRAWIEDYLEDQLELTDDVKASLDQSRRDGKHLVPIRSQPCHHAFVQVLVCQQNHAACPVSG